MQSESNLFAEAANRQTGSRMALQSGDSQLLFIKGVILEAE